MSSEPIPDAEIPEGWTRDGAGIVRSFRFASFDAAWGFMSRVALLAAAADHHPDWRSSWNLVEIRLTSHDAKALTARDVALARRINDLT